MSYLKLKDTYMCEYNRINRIGTDCNTLSSLDCLHDEDDPDFRPDLQTDENCTYKNNAWNCPSLNPGSPTILSPCVCGGQGVCGLNDQGQPVCKCNPGYSGSKCNSCSFGYDNIETRPGYNPICIPKEHVCKYGGKWNTLTQKCDCALGYYGDQCEKSSKPPTPSQIGNGCAKLYIRPWGAGTYIDENSIKIKHGYNLFPGEGPDAFGGYTFSQYEWFFVGFGPDITLTVKSPKGEETGKVQQNFCSSKGGSISTTFTNTSSVEGNFLSGKEGVIYIGPTKA